MTTVTTEQFVRVPPALAYRAFTNATALREWLCDVATVAPHVGGRIYLWWNGDFYSSGHYLALEPEKKVSFRWFANIDPAPSEITVTFQAQDGGTLVRMDHTVPEGEGWPERAGGFRQEWQRSLPNLASVLETGIDRRIADRPMLGILPGDFTPEQASHLGVPVTEGARLDGVVDGMGAQKAGLQKDDVIILLNSKALNNDATSFPAALAGKKGGDPVEVVFYRGPEKHTVTMELTKRPIAEVPFDPAELAAQARLKYEAAFEALTKCFVGVSDAVAITRPAPNEWSALDTLAHILQGERGLQFFITDLVGGYERIGDDWGGNLDAHSRATVAAYPTVIDMLNALERANEETLLLAANLPAEFVANKGSYYRVGNFLLFNDTHIYGHIPQIQAAIAAAQKV
jgi:uncharacterized protein YndB with AHSA1/START domain